MIVAPKITPFEFPVQTKSGDRISVSCVASGSPPATIKWFKDGTPLAQNDVKVVFEEGMAAMFIPNTTPKQAGNYTCTAENPFGRDMFSARLVVRCEFITIFFIDY